MTRRILLLITCLISIFSCTKNRSNPINENNLKYKLKAINYPVDSTTPLCENCPPVITQQSENFIYDSSNRLISRVVILTTFSNNPISIYTSAIYTYFYSDKTFIISGYTQIMKNYVTNHILTYNSQKQLISDSITNPQISNNKISHFDYVQDLIIVTDKQTYPIGTEITIDSMMLDDKNVLEEKTQKNNITNPHGTYYQNLTYKFSSSLNPFSYANNISLLGSDNKNGANSSLYNAENFSNSFVSEKDTKYWSDNLPFTEYTSIYTPTLDSLGRITSVTNSGNGNKRTDYQYY